MLITSPACLSALAWSAAIASKALFAPYHQMNMNKAVAPVAEKPSSVPLNVLPGKNENKIRTGNSAISSHAILLVVRGELPGVAFLLDQKSATPNPRLTNAVAKMMMLIVLKLLMAQEILLYRKKTYKCLCVGKAANRDFG